MTSSNLQTYQHHIHTKPISCITFSPEGDVFWVSSKDKTITVYYTKSGELIGSYKCAGAVNRVAVNDDCSILLAACADQVLYIFNAETGELLNEIEHDSPVLDCKFSLGSNEFFAVTKKSRREPISIHVYRSKDLENKRALPALKIEADSLVTCAVWAPLNQGIIAGCEDGSVVMFDAHNGKALGVAREHTDVINSISLSHDGGMFITASDDKTAKLFDTRTLEAKKTYRLSSNVNTAAISPIKTHVALGGGKAAVTTTTGQQSTYYDAHFFHLVFEEEFGKLKAHFGPVNAVAFSRNGKFFITGGEDGYIKVFKMSPKFLSQGDEPESFFLAKKGVSDPRELSSA